METNRTTIQWRKKSGGKAEKWILPQSDQVLPCFLADSSTLEVARASMQRAIDMLNEAAQTLQGEQILDDEDDGAAHES